MDVKQLLDRYKLSTRQSLYNRLKALEISLEKDSSGKAYATKDQIRMLDELNSWYDR